MALEAENRMKIAKLMAKQQLEIEALSIRGVRGRDELELRRASDTEKRTFRFRNVVTVRVTGHVHDITNPLNFPNMPSGEKVVNMDGPPLVGNEEHV